MSQLRLRDARRERDNYCVGDAVSGADQRGGIDQDVNTRGGDAMTDVIKIDGHSNLGRFCCPFHEEKTPSFTYQISEDKYHCFGCRREGSITDLVADGIVEVV